MISKTITITQPNGMHLRVAAQVVEASQQHDAIVTFYKDGQEASAQSIMELLVLAATENSEVIVTARGAEAHQALISVETVLTDGAGI